MSTRPEHREPPRPAVFVAVALAMFIVYGSLFPFEFASNAPPLETVFNEWNPLLNRSDAIDNIMLFIPFGAALWFACRSPVARYVVAVSSWLLLGTGLQVFQLYVPGRVASMADAINNAAGLIIGLLLARALAPWLQRKQLVGGFTDSFALLLVAFWYGYESFPFLPTLDIGLLAAHIKPALSAPDFELLRLVRHALAAALGALILLAARPLRSRRACVTAALAVLLASEVLVPYGELRIEALLGMVLGTVIGERLDKGLGANARWAVFVLAAVALMMTVATGFRGPSGASHFTLTPFSHLLWQGTTGGIPTAAFEALAIGALMWAGTSGSRPIGASSWHWPAIVVAVVTGLEGVRIALASGPADTSTLVSALLLAPFAARLHGRPVASTPTSDTGDHVGRTAAEPAAGINATGGASVAESVPSHRAVAWRVVAVWVVLTIGLRLLLELPGVPYNVLELFATRSVVDVGLFAMVLLWLGAGPWCIAQWAGRSTKTLLWLPVLLLLASLASLLFLRMSVPQESLNDITGSPDLYRLVTADSYWGEAWRDRMVRFPPDLVSMLERGTRYSALYGLLLAPLTMATLCIYKSGPMTRALPAFGLLTFWWWLAGWLVIDAAVTDNLTELIARDGGWWLAALATGFALHVTWASQPLTARRGLVLGVITLVTLPLSWWLLKHGLEQTILKYGSLWSAQQFLLGHNRNQPLSDGALFMRWSALYIAMFGICALGMSLARQLGTATAAHPPRTPSARRARKRPRLHRRSVVR